MKDKIYYYSSVKNLIAIKTNVKNFKFSYGLIMPEIDNSEFDESLIKIDLQVVKGSVKPSVEQKKDMGKFHYFSGFPNSGEMYYERSFFFKKKLQYKISGINSNTITVVVNKNYMRYVTHRFMNIHSIGYILTDIVNLRLLHNGFAPLHCSGVAIHKKSYVIFAPPNTGKTLTAMSLCIDNKDYSFIAEDLAITDGENVFAVPWTSTFRYYDSIDSSRFSKYLNKLTEKISILELLSFGKVEKVTKYVSKIEDKTNIESLFILDRGAEKTFDINKEDAFTRINTLDRYEFNYMRAPAIIAFEYFNPDTDIEYAYNEERVILKKMIDSAKFTKVISTRNALNYSKEIDNLVNVE